MKNRQRSTSICNVGTPRRPPQSPCPPCPFQLLNKTDGTTHFTGEDEELLSYYAFFAGLALTNVRLYGAVAAAKGPGTGRRADERPERSGRPWASAGRRSPPPCLARGGPAQGCPGRQGIGAEVGF